MMRAATLLIGALLLGCGPSAEPEDPSGAAPSTGGLPATDRDPLPYTPEPRGHGDTDHTISLAASGGEDQARRMLPALLIAVRDGDLRQLEDLFADEVAPVEPRRSRHGSRARARLLQHIQIFSRRGVIPPDAQVEDLVELGGLRVQRAARYWRNRDMPETVRPTDLVVEVPVRPAARGSLQTTLGWTTEGHLVVRPGRDPRIVAL